MVISAENLLVPLALADPTMRSALGSDKKLNKSLMFSFYCTNIYKIKKPNRFLIKKTF